MTTYTDPGKAIDADKRRQKIAHTAAELQEALRVIIYDKGPDIIAAAGRVRETFNYEGCSYTPEEADVNVANFVSRTLFEIGHAYGILKAQKTLTYGAYWDAAQKAAAACYGLERLLPEHYQTVLQLAIQLDRLTTRRW